MIDTPKHQGMRKMLAKLIEDKGITDKRVLEAIAKVPRHLFMDSGFIDFAYQDKAFPIAAEQTISQPFTVAFQTELLQLNEGEKVLEVGTGSGYQTAILIELKAKVYSIERQQELFRKSKLFLPKLGYHAKSLVFGDGYKGIPEYAPFDKIIVTAGAPNIPKTLLGQLKIGGRMVIPVGEEIQTMMVIIRKSETEFEKQEHGSFRFVPLLKDRN
ncbi:MAG TPA: protein-L-isoaspartate(D-aspartate) O-methyltransferase [Flavobacteriaceae bacterium]|nr:protein-L-isoaspartate(D-aspartate) O-methyltransferase [Flavobacteriaceae bacterium]HEX5743275.1 protein-L-isoaspartate(D-aspartate) O-methyltransferase [Flavobacteriaceae bacterium]